MGSQKCNFRLTPIKILTPFLCCSILLRDEPCHEISRVAVERRMITRIWPKFQKTGPFHLRRSFATRLKSKSNCQIFAKNPTQILVSENFTHIQSAQHKFRHDFTSFFLPIGFQFGHG
jgi:hypothetical protein